MRALEHPSHIISRVWVQHRRPAMCLCNMTATSIVLYEIRWPDEYLFWSNNKDTTSCFTAPFNHLVSVSAQARTRRPGGFTRSRDAFNRRVQLLSRVPQPLLPHAVSPPPQLGSATQFGLD